MVYQLNKYIIIFNLEQKGVIFFIVENKLTYQGTKLIIFESELNWFKKMQLASISQIPFKKMVQNGILIIGNQ